MVNGPRPAKLLTPGGSASPNNGVTPARSPLFLQRQTTSVYSTVTSTGTPVLVYGKAATPIAGAWSAEPWSAEEVAATPLPGALEEPTNAAAPTEAPAAQPTHLDDDDVSSVAETAAFTDTASTVHTRSPVQAAAPPMPTSAAPAAVATTTNNHKHVAFKYRFDPYATAGAAPRRETYRCDCEACIDAATLGSDRLIGDTYDAAAYYATNGDAPAAFDRYASSETAAPYAADDATSAAGMSWAATAETAAAMPPAETTSSNFIPPPPPPRIARGIMAESAEDALDVDAAFYHIAMRWYTKVAAVQAHFVTAAEDYCPEPSEEMAFDDWVHAAGRWWLRHFEHAQVKSSPSSGLLRTAPAPANARAASDAPAAFETHTTVNESYANHRHALRSGPRKAFGSSNLTASMLANLGNSKPSLPAPRSSATRLESLPW